MSLLTLLNLNLGLFSVKLTFQTKRLSLTTIYDGTSDYSETGVKVSTGKGKWLFKDQPWLILIGLIEILILLISRIKGGGRGQLFFRSGWTGHQSKFS